MPSSTTKSSSQVGSSSCAKCDTDNPDDAKFCRGCGESLWQQCRKCNNCVRIGIAFCGSCGSNLEEAHQDLRTEMKQTLLRAKTLGTDHDYEDAIYLAKSVAEAPDFRFDDLVEKAKLLKSKLESRRDKYIRRVAQVVPAAKSLFERGDVSAGIELLGTVPEKLLDDEILQIAKGARLHQDESQQLIDGLRKAVAGKQFQEAGPLIDRVLQLNSEDKKMQKLALQIGSELMKSAMRKQQRGDFRGSIDRLDNVPAFARSENYRCIRRQAEELFFLRSQMVRCIYATPTLANFCGRLAKMTPGDQTTVKLHQQIVDRIKTGKPSERGLYPRWNQKNSDFLGCEVNYLARLQSIRFAEVEAMQKQPLRFAASLGTALQGIGKARFDLRFAGKQQSGLRGLLKRKKQSNDAAWGFDIGPSALRAVRLEANEEGIPQVTDAEFMEFDAPLSRLVAEGDGSESLRDKLEQLKKKYSLHDEAVWILAPSRQSLGRFLDFPPTNDKKLQELVAAEVGHRFPIPKDQLVWKHWLSESEAEDVGSRYASIVGVRSYVVDQQLQIFRDVGIEPAGMQAEPIALANLICHEFHEELRSEDSESSSAVALLDVGVDTTVLVVCCDKGFWCRTFDLGGDQFSSALAREKNLTLAQAETLKMNINGQEYVEEIYESFNESFRNLNGRLKNMLGVCRSELGDFRLQSFWCTGGACALHGFMECVFSDD